MAEQDLAALVNANDVEAALLRPLRPAESEYIDLICQRASSRLRGRRPDIDVQIALYPGPGGVDPEIVRDVLANAIKRVLINPKGVTSVSDTQGPSSHSESYSGRGAGDDGTPALVITDADLAQLRPVLVAKPRGTIWTRPPAWR